MQAPVARYGRQTMPGLRGTQVGMDFTFAEAPHCVAPLIPIVSQQCTISQVPQLGLAAEIQTR